MSTSLTQKDILYQARASATQQLCYAFLTEPPLCFRRKNCILKRQQYQFCINTGFSRRGQMSIKRNSDFFFFWNKQEIWSKEPKILIKHQSKTSLWQEKCTLYLSCLLINQASFTLGNKILPFAVCSTFC